jgi:hypothetical protein
MLSSLFGVLLLSFDFKCWVGLGFCYCSSQRQGGARSRKSVVFFTIGKKAALGIDIHTLHYIKLHYITYIHTYTHVASSCFCFSSRSPWSTKRISFQLKRLDTWHMLGVHLPAQKRRRYMPCLWLSRHHLLLCVLDLCSKQSAGQVTTALHRVVPMHVHFHWMHPASLCFHFFILFHRCGHSRHWPTYWDIGRWAEASSKARST